MRIKTFFNFVILSALYLKVTSRCKYSLTTVSGTLAPKERICSGELIFEDNFDDFNLHIWKHEQTLGGGSNNNQFQWYTNNRSNTYVDNGVLHIRPTLLEYDKGDFFLYNGTLNINGNKPTYVCTNPSYNGCMRTGTKEIILNPIKSARIHTCESFAFKYGYIEIKAKLPVGDWLWPAIWMKPKWNKYSMWPASGEIDIVESRGNSHFFKDNINTGVQQVSCTLHWGPNSKFNRYNYTSFKKNNNGFHTKFHRYQLEWKPESLTFLIDDVEIANVTPPNKGFWELGRLNITGLDNPWKEGSKIAPFDEEFYFVVNVAVGGTSFFSDLAENKPYKKPWRNDKGRASVTDFWKAKDQWLPTWNIQTDNSHLQIDYIRVRAL